MMAVLRDPGHRGTNRDGAVARSFFSFLTAEEWDRSAGFAHGSEALLPVVIAVLVEAVTKITAGVEAGQLSGWR
jgi:hypothetical protein